MLLVMTCVPVPSFISILIYPFAAPTNKYFQFSIPFGDQRELTRVAWNGCDFLDWHSDRQDDTNNNDCLTVIDFNIDPHTLDLSGCFDPAVQVNPLTFERTLVYSGFLEVDVIEHVGVFLGNRVGRHLYTKMYYEVVVPGTVFVNQTMKIFSEVPVPMVALTDYRYE